MGAGARSIDPGPDPGNGVPEPETVGAVVEVEVEVEVAEDGSVTGGNQEDSERRQDHIAVLLSTGEKHPTVFRGDGKIKASLLEGFPSPPPGPK